MTLLRVENLSKHFGGLGVLTEVSFAAEPGEKLALIGPNGAGKTTLLNVIGGQLSASSGDVWFDKRRITALPPNKRLHLGLGRSYQINNLFFTLRVLDNVLLALYGGEKSHFRMLGTLVKRGDLLAHARRLLETVGLWEKRFHALDSLSYGDQRLVELLCAFTSRPKLVLLDEPSAGLPTAEASAFADVIRRLSGETAILFCAHDMDLVFNLADRIMVLCFGRIIASGNPQEISADPKVREIYLGADDKC
ncbi:MAG: ABC transporter ATP-binding protein [Actinobacteria bacterium]|nr:ABC transporter ATP-binding protein [Actinomycetota bacterium]